MAGSYLFIIAGERMRISQPFPLSSWLPTTMVACLAFGLVGCEPPEGAEDVQEAQAAAQEEVKPPATTAYGKAMEAATDLRDKKVPEYNKKLEDLADPFNQ